MNKYQYTVQGVDYDVEIEEVEGNLAKVSVNGVKFDVELKEPIRPSSAVKQTKVAAPAPKPAAAAPAQPAAAPGSGNPVKSPLPGTITTVCVNVGDKVKDGDTVVVLEAMKMQNNIEAEGDGTVTSILVKQGDSVMEGTVLITIA